MDDAASWSSSDEAQSPHIPKTDFIDHTLLQSLHEREKPVPEHSDFSFRIILIDHTANRLIHHIPSQVAAGVEYLSAKVHLLHYSEWYDHLAINFKIIRSLGERRTETIHHAMIKIPATAIQAIDVKFIEPITTSTLIDTDPRLKTWRTENNLGCIRFQFNQEDIQHNGSIAHEGDQSYPQLELINQQLQTTGRLYAYVFWMDIFDQQIKDFLNSQSSKRNYLASFYPETKGKAITQPGKYPNASERPNVMIPAQLASQDFAEYTTIIEFGAIQEHEDIKSLNDLWQVDGSIHVLSIPFLSPCWYAALLQWGAWVEDKKPPRFTPGDVLDIFFDAGKCVKKEAWRFEVISYLPGAGSEDVELGVNLYMIYI